MSKESRIKSLRAKLGLLRPKYPPPPDLIISFIRSDLVEQQCSYARVGGRRFDRRPGETVKDLTARVVALLEQHPSLVFLHSEETRLIAENQEVSCGGTWIFTASRCGKVKWAAKLGDVLHRLMQDKKRNDYHNARVLPQEEDMDQLFRYDKALQKKYDWALQKLLESQERRRKAEAPVSVQVSGNQ